MSSLPPDPWQVLGIAKTADKTEIRTAYRKLVLKCHPDKVQDPTLKAEKQDEFQKVQQAYELLNNDEERAKYEHQVRMQELNQQKARATSKTAANSPAARSSPRHKEFAFSPPERPSHRTTTSTREKMYFQPSRSHEEVPTARFADMGFSEERRARRATSYEKQPRHEEERPPRREEERTFRREEERPSRREEERPLRREEERSKDKRRDEEEKRAKRQKDMNRELDEMEPGRKPEKKKTDRERERVEKERKVEEKSRRHKGPSVEVTEDPEEFPKSDKKSARSSIKKHLETKERERDGSRSREYDFERENSASRPVAGPVSEDPLEKAKLYMMSKGTRIPEPERIHERIPKLPRAQTFSFKNEVPRTPKADYDDDEVPRSSARPRRSSHETPVRSKDGPHIIEVTPGPTPINVKASKSPGVPPPQVSPSRPLYRSQTAHEVHSGHHFPAPPHLQRHTTWAPTSSDRHFETGYHNDSDDDYARRHRSRYADSPSDSLRYKADISRSSRHDEPTYPKSYSRGTSATRVAPNLYGPARVYSSSGMNVKEGKRYDITDVNVADMPYATRSPPISRDPYFLRTDLRAS